MQDQKIICAFMSDTNTNLLIPKVSKKIEILLYVPLDCTAIVIALESPMSLKWRYIFFSELT